MSTDHRNNQQKPPTTTMNEPPAETIAWLKQSAKLDGSTYSQILLMILERLELLERCLLEQEAAENLRRQDEDVELAVSTPEAAPVATDEDLWALAEHERLEHQAWRACYNLGREHGAAAPQPTLPVALGDALIRAESALSDIAEGEETNAAPNTFEWAEQHCADALAAIRPVMRQHKIRTSEWPGCGFNPPQPNPPGAPAGGLVERVADAVADASVYLWNQDARIAIREVAAWLDQRGQHGCSLWLREEADRG